VALAAHQQVFQFLFSLWMWKTLLQYTLGVKQAWYDTQVMMHDQLVDFGSLSDCILLRVALVAH
jgi:hypothetical protein